MTQMTEGNSIHAAWLRTYERSLRATPGDTFFHTYRYTALPDTKITFGVKACIRDDSLRFYPLGFPQNARTVGANGGEGYATADEAFAWHTDRIGRDGMAELDFIDAEAIHAE